MHALLTGLLSKATSAGLTAKVAAGAAALLVAGGGMAATAQALEPTAAETTTDTTADPAVTEPTEPGQETEPTDSTPPETPQIIEPDVDGSVPESFESGREHGKAVSSAAHDKGRKSEPVSESPEAGTETLVESSSTAETDQLPADAVSGSAKRGKG